MAIDRFFIPALLATGLLSACGASPVEKDARAVCSCLQSAAGKDLPAKKRCLDLQRAMGEKYLGSPEDLQTYNSIVTPCIMETVQNNLNDPH